jgi:flagellar hook-length control protein FliK
MPDISISPQLNNLPNNSIATASADTANTFHQTNENFSKIMEREVSNNTSDHQPDVTAAREDSATNNGLNIQSLLINPISEELLQQLFITQETSSAALVDHPFIDKQTDFIDVTLATSTNPAINQAPTQNIFNQNNVSEYSPQQSFNTANFAGANRILPPLVEEYGNNTPSVFLASLISPATNTAQQNTTKNATLFTSSAYQMPVADAA